MTTMPLKRISRFLAIFGFGLSASIPFNTSAQTPIGYWFAFRTNQFVDKQVAQEIAKHSGLVVLQGTPNNILENYAFHRIANRIKQERPTVPVISYAFVSRQVEHGRMEAYLFKGLDFGQPLTETNTKDHGRTLFLDVTNPTVREKVTKALVGFRKPLGIDGYAIDLSHRTPAPRPQVLAKACAKTLGLCEKYPESMDVLFADIRSSLGSSGVLIFNGLWNHAPDVLEDQARLLSHADAAAVEYFGMNPNQREHSFGNDILPYLKTMARLPANKSILVFGRGPWFYTDYADDYRWQRYLYASFLLAARERDMFKYHATFQVPTNKGRSGGFDYYADSALQLGAAQGPSSYSNGLYQRNYAQGLVLVAPDDGRGGSTRLARAYETPEGERIEGNVQLSPGEGLILLHRHNAKPVRQVISARTMAAWGWAQSSAVTDALRLDPLPEQLPGEHDLLLDYERSLTPFRLLEVNAQLESADAAMYAVAEIDDPRREQMWLIVRISKQATAGTRRESVDFRSPSKKQEPALWPMLQIAYPSGQGEAVTLDGNKLASEAGFAFRRWSHIRFAGPLLVSEVALSAPTPLRLPR